MPLSKKVIPFQAWLKSAKTESPVECFGVYLIW